MIRRVLPVVLLLLASAPAAAQQTLDEFLAIPARMEDVETLLLVITSQTDLAVAEKNTAELRKRFWFNRPEARLTPQERELATFELENQWKTVCQIVRERNMTSLSFVGMDLVLFRKAMDWYFGDVTPRGPVLIRVSVQFNPDSPVTIHGVEAWTDWHGIRAITRGLQIPAGRKVLTVTYTPAAAEGEETK